MWLIKKSAFKIMCVKKKSAFKIMPTVLENNLKKLDTGQAGYGLKKTSSLHLIEIDYCILYIGYL